MGDGEVSHKPIRIMAGQPTKYNEEVQKLAEDYLINFEKLGDPFPSVVGLACELKVCEKTIYNWANTEGNEIFLQTLSRIKATQHRKAVAGGIYGVFNPAITKLILHNHGYSDKTDQTMSGPGGSPIETNVNLTVDWVSADKEDDTE